MNETVKNLEAALANVLKKLRVGAGVSQEELAFKAGLHPTYISQLERGLKNPTFKTLCKIAPAVGVGIVELVKQVEYERSH